MNQRASELKESVNLYFNLIEVLKGYGYPVLAFLFLGVGSLSGYIYTQSILFLVGTVFFLPTSFIWLVTELYKTFPVGPKLTLNEEGIIVNGSMIGLIHWQSVSAIEYLPKFESRLRIYSTQISGLNLTQRVMCGVEDLYDYEGELIDYYLCLDLSKFKCRPERVWTVFRDIALNKGFSLSTGDKTIVSVRR